MDKKWYKKIELIDKNNSIVLRSVSHQSKKCMSLTQEMQVSNQKIQVIDQINRQKKNAGRRSKNNGRHLPKKCNLLEMRHFVESIIFMFKCKLNESS